MTGRIDDDYFADMYAKDPDPWGFDTRWYERRKFELTVAALPRERYQRAFEPGCANGALTARLASRCDEVVAFELMTEVADRARARLQPHAHVAITRAAIPDAWPEGTFDLFVFSEVLYYLRRPSLDDVLQRVEKSARPRAQVIAVHWRGETDYPLTGDDVHSALQARWSRESGYQERSFALDVFEVA